MSKWDKPIQPEVIQSHLRNIMEGIGTWIGDHFRLPVFFYSHSEHIEFGTDEDQPKAPCIIVCGPSITKSGDMGNLDTTFDTGVNGIGQVKTRKYGLIKWKDLTFDYLLEANNVLDLADLMESSVILFTDNAFLSVDSRNYKVWELQEPSVSQVINHTNTNLAKGQFQLRGVPLGSPYSPLSSGRVYSTHIRKHGLQDTNTEQE